MWLLLAASSLLTPATRLGRRGGACLLTASDPSLSKEGAGAPGTARSDPRGQRANRRRREQRERQQRERPPYLARALKPEDRLSYKAAGLLVTTAALTPALPAASLPVTLATSSLPAALSSTTFPATLATASIASSRATASMTAAPCTCC